MGNIVDDDDDDDSNRASIAIIVPFRDLHKEQRRSSHLKQFIPHMKHMFDKALTEDKLLSNYHIYIIEQSDDRQDMGICKHTRTILLTGCGFARS